MKAGKEYELLIERLYRDLEPNSIVKHDDYVYDEWAKNRRQIDVTIRSKLLGLDYLTIVQAKDYKVKADIKVVDQFIQVVKDVKANKGILICSKGFSKTALNKAKSYGIECLTIHSALNKKWETILKIPVEKVMHEFDMNYDIMMPILDEFRGKKINCLFETFSYDKLNILDISQIILDLIINKYPWDFIKKGNTIKIDLKKIKLFHPINNKMVQIEDGFISIKFIKSYKTKFYIEPTNYIYEINHITDSKNLHNLTISEESLDYITTQKQENNVDIIEKPLILAKIFNFSEFYMSSYSFDFRGGIKGDFIIKDDSFMKNTERNRAIMELERKLKQIQSI